jgi:hypothetical protein
MITDDNLRLLVDEVDEFLICSNIKYKMDPLSLTGVILARLAITAKAVNGMSEFLNLLDSSKETLANELDSINKTDKIVH